METVPTELPVSEIASRIAWVPAVPMMCFVLVFLLDVRDNHCHWMEDTYVGVANIVPIPR